MYGKATKRAWRTKSPKNQDKPETPTYPGSIVNVDMMESPSPGFVAQMTGILTKKRYKYAIVYVDQFSDMTYAYLQKSPDAEESVAGKKSYERFAATHGVQIHHYHADNGIFRAKKWVEHCKMQGQGLTFAGVNAHHQNGLAEVRIRYLQDSTRTNMIHAIKRWGSAISIHLWPYALREACDSHNNLPNLKDKRGRTPFQIFAKTDVYCNPKHYHPIFCPVYVLESKLQASQPFHKWNKRARVGIYLGRSPTHFRSVAMVMNIHTGLVSPQFHVRFDPWFQTVRSTTRQEAHSCQWHAKAGFDPPSSHQLINEGEHHSKKKHAPNALFGHEDRIRRESHKTDARNVASERRTTPSHNKQGTRDTGNISRTNDAETHDTSTDDNMLSTEEQRRNSQNEFRSAAPISLIDDGNPNNDRHSGRRRTPVQRLIEVMSITIAIATAENDVPGEIFCMEVISPIDNTSYHDPLFAFKASSDPDTMYMHEAMREPDKEEFIKAMKKEVEDQVQGGVYSIVHKSTLPKGATLLPAVWQMKRKRDIMSGNVKKYKARLNIDGSRMIYQKDYDLTFSPVASWTTVRLLLAMTLLNKWHTQQLDYVLAYPQAPVERDMWMKIPKGFEVAGYGIYQEDAQDYVLKIHKNIYGGKAAGRVWNKYLVKKLKKIGFNQSKIDECLFYKGNTIYVLYTDDSILAGPNKSEIDSTIIKMQTTGLKLTDEGSLTDFLGVNLDRQDDGTIHLSQPRLIQQIMKELRIDDQTKTKEVPMASSRLLAAHQDSPEFDNSFHYRRVIGQLNYLEKGSRPDIAYAAHQCARFSANPRKEHGAAVRWLGKYLKGTSERGTYFKPNPKQGLEVYVDASFLGEWDPTNAWHDRDTARSRMGYVIMYGGVPLVSKSQLIGEICLSATEAEYVGLSYSLREAIPIIETLKEMKQHGFQIHPQLPSVHCRVFEDNSGALEMAKIHKHRPRTKHLNCKLHHFRSFVENENDPSKPGEISIHKISTDEQPADIFTKPLPLESFTKHRNTIMGWHAIIQQ